MIDPQIFINQKHILKPYNFTGEPIALVIQAKRTIQKVKTEEIYIKEIEKADLIFQKKLKAGIKLKDVETAKASLAIPKNLFHCLLLNTQPGSFPLDERLDLIFNEYKILIRQYHSPFNREILRENFLNGICNTMVLLYEVSYKPNSDKDRTYPESVSLNLNAADNPLMLTNFTTINCKEKTLSEEELTVEQWFSNRSVFLSVVNHMIHLKILDKNRFLIKRKKKKLNLYFIKLNELKIIDIDDLSATVIVEKLESEFGASSNHQFYSALLKQFNEGSLSDSDISFINKLDFHT